MDKFKRIIDANKIALDNLEEEEGMIIFMYYAKWTDTKTHYIRRNAWISELCYVSSVVNKVVKDVLDDQDYDD